MHINVFQVVYFTATFPYVILIALLVRGVTLPGASVGLEYLFIPDWSKLLEFQVWRNAAEQMFFSLGISWGGLMMFGNFLDKINLTLFYFIILAKLFLFFFLSLHHPVTKNQIWEAKFLCFDFYYCRNSKFQNNKFDIWYLLFRRRIMQRKRQFFLKNNYVF